MQEQNLGTFNQVVFCLIFCFCFCQVTVKNDFTDESYDSTWHYLNHVEYHSKTTGTTHGHDDRVLHDDLLQSKVQYVSTYSLYNIDTNSWHFNIHSLATLLGTPS